MRPTRRPIMVLLACVASLTLTCSVMPVPAMAASSASIARSIAAKRKQAAAAAKTLATSQQELTDALTKADDVENQLEAAREDLTVTSDTLAQLETQITTGQDVLNDRAVALYKSGGMDVIQALLSVQSLDDLMTRVDLLSYIQQSDDDLLKSLTTARDQASFLQGQQTQRENDLIALRQESAARTAAVQAIIGQQKALMSSLGTAVTKLVKQEATAKAAEAAAAGGNDGVANPPVGFSPNTLISQAKFTDAGSLSEAGIQGFLNAQPGSLKSYSTRDHAGATKTAAEMIAEAAVAWGVSPKVILVTLQKEQSVLTDPSPSQHTLDWAMGCGATDSGRIPQYSGFGNQIWSGARALARNQSSWHSGISLRIDGNSVYPSNSATFSLYRYTPHLHGNVSFWRLYWRYFNTPTG